MKKISPYNIKKGILYLRHYGPKGFWIKLTERFQKSEIDYKEWLEKNMPTRQELDRQGKHKFKYAPKISILVPVYNTPETFLRQMIESVQKQTYGNWELCIANANPANEQVKAILKEYTENDARVKVTDVPENEGIAQNTNKALEIADGTFIGLLDHDDVLAENALYEVVKELIETVGGFRGEYNGAQDYDLFLRCIEKAERIAHIPKILYHWRVHQESTADNPLSKMYAYDAGQRAIEEHLKRCGVTAAEVFKTENLGFYRVKYHQEGSPLVSILIPNKDQKDTLDQCLKSIEARTDYENYEIIVIENNSTEKETFEYYKQIKNPKVRVIEWKDEFNYSAINNFGVRHAKGEYLLFLNNDIEVINSDWLGEMLSNCQREEVGAVGAKLYYPDNTVQHAGVIVGIGGVAGSVFVGLKRGYTGYMHRASIQQNLSAVTAACMMVKKSVFEEVGGFEEELKVAFNDIDFCLKIREKGHLIVYDPYVELYHYESKTRGAEDTTEKIRRFQSEIEYMRSHWSSILKNGDPAYNPNLSLKKWDYSLRVN